MKFVTIITPKPPQIDRESWHKVFAFFPKKAEPIGNRQCYVWLEQVERKGTRGYTGWEWRYREVLE